MSFGTVRMRSGLQTAEMSFLSRVAVLSLRDKVRSLDIWRDLGIELLFFHVKGGQLRCSSISSGCLLGTFLWSCSGHILLAGHPRAVSELWRDYIAYLVAGRKSWNALLQRGMSGKPY